MSGDDGGSYSDLRVACNEARRTLDQQIEKIHKEDQKAVGIFRLNLLVLGILSSGVSLSIRTDTISASNFVNAHVAIGASSLILSTVLAAMTYTSSSFSMGIKPGPVTQAANDGYESGEFLNTLSSEYSNWLEYNQKVHKFNANSIVWAMIFAVAGLVFFIGGIAIGVLQIRGSPESYILLAVELILAMILAGFIYYSDEIFETLGNID